MTDPIHIAVAADHRYLPGLLVTVVSMIRATKSRDRLAFHVFSAGLTDADKDEVIRQIVRLGVAAPEFHEPDMARIAASFKAYKGSHATYLRLFLPTLLTTEWVIYSDVDTLWLRDIAELWNLRDEAATIQWCRDLPSIRSAVGRYSKWNPTFDEASYCCAGVALLNLRRLRETNLPEQSYRFAERWGTPFFVDQDILNYICRDTAKILPQVWDCLNPTREAIDGLVYHFNGIGRYFNSSFRGWRPLYYPWFRYYYDFIVDTPNRVVCPWSKRLLFWLLGMFYPSRKFISLVTHRNLALTDNIERQLFFAWLWRHANWRWKGPNA